jgi:hypothetical protein
VFSPLVDLGFIGENPGTRRKVVDAVNRQAELFFPPDAGPDSLAQIFRNSLPRIKDVVVGHVAPAPSPNINLILNKLGEKSIYILSPTGDEKI